MRNAQVSACSLFLVSSLTLWSDHARTLHSDGHRTTTTCLCEQLSRTRATTGRRGERTTWGALSMVGPPNQVIAADPAVAPPGSEVWEPGVPCRRRTQSVSRFRPYDQKSLGVLVLCSARPRRVHGARVRPGTDGGPTVAAQQVPY